MKSAQFCVSVTCIVAVIFISAREYKKVANAGYILNVFEPVIGIISYEPISVLIAGIVLLALCDIGQIGSSHIYMILRCKRVEWLTSEVLLSIILVVFMYAVLGIISVLAVAPITYADNYWSYYTTSGYSIYDLSKVVASYNSPISAVLIAICLQILHVLTLASIMLMFNLFYNSSRGAIAALAIELISYMMSEFVVPELNTVSIMKRSMLIWNGNNTQRIIMSVAFYVILLTINITMQSIALKRYRFIVRKSE